MPGAISNWCTDKHSDITSNNTSVCIVTGTRPVTTVSQLCARNFSPHHLLEPKWIKNMSTADDSLICLLSKCFPCKLTQKSIIWQMPKFSNLNWRMDGYNNSLTSPRSVLYVRSVTGGSQEKSHLIISTSSDKNTTQTSKSSSIKEALSAWCATTAQEIEVHKSTQNIHSAACIHSHIMHLLCRANPIKEQQQRSKQEWKSIKSLSHNNTHSK